ncbi:hypothetical protein NDU88_001377 [Pleurodeles waltl]|uniref:Secreted protein n=1 Tax=Pleurodeles waltl TaxID=8319 RepID=A0AAV7ND72_PLEWA|nr:hypothetical protein NDU88_001377 [Pleurodeles waltl]
MGRAGTRTAVLVFFHSLQIRTCCLCTQARPRDLSKLPNTPLPPRYLFMLRKQHVYMAQDRGEERLNCPRLMVTPKCA